MTATAEEPLALSLSERYDLLIHIMEESPLTPEKRLESVEALFPALRVGGDHFEDKVSEFVLELYGYYRSLGMSIADSAHGAEISASLMQKVMEGEGVSIEILLAIAKAEIFTSAETKGRHLKALDGSGEKGATVAFLEKIYPKEYTQKGVLEQAAELLSNPKKWEVEITHVDNKIKETADAKEVS